MKIYSTIDIRKFEDEKFLSDALSNSSVFRKKKYEAMNNSTGKLQVLANTYLLNKCLNELNLNEKDMEYAVEKNGKLRFTNAENVHFNLSHSKNMSLAVVSDKPVGCDIQFIDKVDEKLYDLVLSEYEKRIVKGDCTNPVGGECKFRRSECKFRRGECKFRRGECLQSPDIVWASSTSPAEKFYELWAMKEAIIKKDGTGLRDNLADVHDDNVYIEKRFLKSNEIVEEYILAII